MIFNAKTQYKVKEKDGTYTFLGFMQNLKGETLIAFQKQQYENIQDFVHLVLTREEAEENVLENTSANIFDVLNDV